MLQEKLCTSLEGLLADHSISVKHVKQAQDDIATMDRVDDLHAAELVYALMLQDPTVTAKVLSALSSRTFTAIEETEEEQYIAIK